MRTNIVKGMIINLLIFQYAYAIDAGEIIGNWVNAKGDGIIAISIAQSEYAGTIIGTPDPKNNGRKDTNNPDPKLQGRLLEGAKILSGFSYTEDNLWSGGTIYDPNNGKTYKCKLSLNEDGTLNVRGYVGVSLFGRTEIWKRQK